MGRHKATNILLIFGLLFAACGQEQTLASKDQAENSAPARAEPIKHYPVPDGFFEAFDRVKTLDDCVTVFEQFPDMFNSSECFFIKGRAEDRLPEAIAMLQKILAQNGDNIHARLILGTIQKNEQMVMEGIESYRSQGRLLDEARGRLNLCSILRRKGKLAPIQEQLELALQAVENPGLPRGMICLVRVKMAQHTYVLHHYGRCFRQFKELENNYCYQIKEMGQQGYILHGLAGSSAELGYYNEAFEYLQRELDLAGKSPWEAQILASMAEVAREVDLPRKFSPEEILQREQDALRVAQSSPNAFSLARAHLTLGNNWLLPADERIQHLNTALNFFRRHDRVTRVVDSLVLLAETQLDQTPEHSEKAFSLINEAIDLALAHDELGTLTSAWSERAMMRWRVGPQTQAIADSLSALEVIEELRRQQPVPMAKAQLGSRFISFFRFCSGRLLAIHAASADEDKLKLAFHIAERMRARTLLNSLAQENEPGKQNLKHENDDLSRLQADLVALQKKLMDSRLAAAERQRILAELEKTEYRILSAQYPRADEPEHVAAPGKSMPAQLTQIQQALNEDQALLAYQIEKRAHHGLVEYRQKHRRGGSWLLAITRSHANLYPLSDYEQLQPEVQLFGGLIARRDGSEQAGGNLLYRRLLAPALAALPSNVKRLVIVPDDPLFQLPFEALHATPQSPPLALEYNISVVPSATMWLHLRKQSGAPPSSSVLVLADPELPDAGSDSATRFAGIFYRGFQLGQLPHARVEAQTMVEHFGGHSRLLKGKQATESFLKQARLGDYGILHFAAHAVVDQKNPQRSAVVLTPGSKDEDGLLQVPEIARLDLNGQVVLLSTCSSAGGALVEGEGVMSLARAFFQAGASAVIGNLWPLRDQEAAELVGDFAQKLAQGSNVGEALQATKKDWVEQGKPAAAWAGLIIQGHADVQIFAATSPNASFRWRMLLLAILAAMAVGFIFRAAKNKK